MPSADIYLANGSLPGIERESGGLSTEFSATDTADTVPLLGMRCDMSLHMLGPVKSSRANRAGLPEG